MVRIFILYYIVEQNLLKDTPFILQNYHSHFARSQIFLTLTKYVQEDY
jgi:hypothetical protein